VSKEWTLARYHEIENGKGSPPTLDELKDIARVLDITLAELLLGPPEELAGEPIVDDLATALGCTAAEIQEAVITDLREWVQSGRLEFLP
jgi:transcriptional regulator with XRE-family HTH domain